MRFESRELKPYAEPISDAELVEGRVYFFVNFVDDAMLIPVMIPQVFVGMNLEKGDIKQVYFQDIDSYNSGVRYHSAKGRENAVFESGSKNEIGHIFDYEHALEVLMACSLRRRKNNV